MRRHALSLSLVCALTCACSSAPSDPSSGAGKKVTNQTEPAPPIDHPPVDPGLVMKSAEVRRLTIQQVRLSLPIAFGLDADGEEITWMLSDGSKGLDKMSDSLGEADFIDTTEDGLEASPMYLKFMDDAARDVCNRALVADAAKADAAERVLMPHADVAENLRYLVLRLHGVKIAADDATSMAPLTELYTSAVDAAAGGAAPDDAAKKEGWRAVCVALVTAPEFHLY